MPASKRSMDPDWSDEDDAPDLSTPEYRQKFAVIPVKRGRPKLIAPKQLVSLRLDADVIASFRSSGPGWQTRAARILKEAIQSGLPMAVAKGKRGQSEHPCGSPPSRADQAGGQRRSRADGLG
jgi:uncharacterized protein (DUF4415 family)